MAIFELKFTGNSTNLKRSISDINSLLRGLQSRASSLNINIGGRSVNRNITNLNTRLSATKTLLTDISRLSTTVNNNLGGRGSSNSAATAAIQQQRLALAQANTAAGQYRARIAQLNSQIAQLRLTQAQNRQGTVAAAGSYREAQQRLTALGQAIRNAAGGFASSNPQIQAQIAQYRALNDQLRAFDRAMGNNQRNVGNYPFAGAINQIKGLVGQYLSLYSAIALVRKVVDVNKGIDESLVDVGRTTHLTGLELEGLIKSLQKIDTRTSLKGLLDISFIAGKLGVAQGEIAGFTKAADQLQLALGKEIGGNIEQTTEQLGRLVEIFSDGEGITGNALQRFANSIIDLAHAGTASSEFIIDFSKRLAGVKGIADISAGSVFGMGAALQELGQTAEVGGTAVTQVLLKMGTNLSKFARLAGKDLAEFRRTYETNAIEALIQFAEGMAKSADSTEELAKVFAEAEARGVRVISTLGTIGSRADLFREKIGLASESIQKTDTITRSAELRMRTLGAAFDEVSKQLENAFQSNSLGEFATRLVGIDSAMNQMTRATHDATEAATAQDVKIGELLTRFTQLSNNTNRTTDENRELRTVIQQIADFIPTAVTAFDSYGNALDVSAERVRNLNTAYKNLIRDQNLSAISTLNREFTDNAKDIEDAQNRLNKALSQNQRLGGVLSEAAVIQGRQGLAKLNQEALNLIKNIESLGGELTDSQKKIKAYYTELENPPKSLEQLRKEFDKFSEGLEVKVSVDDENFLNSIKGIQKRIAQLKGLEGSSIEGSPILEEIRELEARLKALRGSKTRVTVEAEPGSFKALQKQLSDLQARSDSSVIGSDTFKQIQELEKRIKVLGDTMKNPVTLSSYLKKNFEDAVKAFDKVNFDRLKVRGNVETSLNIDTIIGNTNRINQAGQYSTDDAKRISDQITKEQSSRSREYQDLRARMLADQDRWAKEASKNAQKSGEDYYQAFSRGVDRFATDFYETLTTLNKQTDATFGGIFSTLTQGLFSSFQQVFLGGITSSLTADLGKGLNKIELFGLETKFSKALLAGAGLAGGVLAGVISKTSSAGQAAAGGLSGAAAGAGLGATLLKSTKIFGVGGEIVGAVAGGLVGIIGGLFGASKARKQQEEIQRQQLEELKKQTELARQNALAFTSAIIGQQTTGGIVTGVDRDAFGNLVATIAGRDIKLSMERETAAQLRGL